MLVTFTGTASVPAVWMTRLDGGDAHRRSHAFSEIT
jgi:hypothetical protein